MNQSVPLPRCSGDLEAWSLLCVDGRQWKSRLPRYSQRFQFESESKFAVQPFLVSAVCLYRTEIDVSRSLPRLCYSPVVR
jgi:hypothetical protein